MPFLVLLLLSAGLANAASPDFERGRKKIELIEYEKAPYGSTVVFTPKEINEWARAIIPTYVPHGFRDLLIVLGENTATGTALIDFARVRHVNDSELTILDKLIAGERPVLVTVTEKSANGICHVDLNKLTISNVSASGYVMDLLIRSFVLPMFPEVKVGEPFELRHRIEKITIKPSGLYVKIKASPKKA